MKAKVKTIEFPSIIQCLLWLQWHHFCLFLNCNEKLLLITFKYFKEEGGLPGPWAVESSTKPAIRCRWWRRTPVVPPTPTPPPSGVCSSRWPRVRPVPLSGATRGVGRRGSGGSRRPPPPLISRPVRRLRGVRAVWRRRGAGPGPGPACWHCCGSCCWRAAGSGRAPPTTAAGGAGRRVTARGGSRGPEPSREAVRRSRRVPSRPSPHSRPVRGGAAGDSRGGRQRCLAGGCASVIFTGRYAAKLYQKFYLIPLGFGVFSFG